MLTLSSRKLALGPRPRPKHTFTPARAPTLRLMHYVMYYAMQAEGLDELMEEEASKDRAALAEANSPRPFSRDAADADGNSADEGSAGGGGGIGGGLVKKAKERRRRRAGGRSAMAAGLMKKRGSADDAAKAVYTADGKRIVKSEPGAYWRGDQRAAAPDDDASERERAPRSGAELWAKARVVKTQVILTQRWHEDVNTWYKRLWLVFKGSHTLLAGLLYRGTVGFSRAQTVMILSNSVVLELVVLCMQYTVEEVDTVEVDLVTVAASGTFAALICIPGMLVFAAAFHPQAPKHSPACTAHVQI